MSASQSAVLESGMWLMLSTTHMVSMYVPLHTYILIKPVICGTLPFVSPHDLEELKRFSSKYLEGFYLCYTKGGTVPIKDIRVPSN